MNSQPGQRFAFRVAFAYFAAFLVSSVFNNTWPWLTAPRDSALYAVWELLSLLAFAVTTAAIWCVLVRNSSPDLRLYRIMRVAMRYYTGVIVLIYAGFKVVPAQFPPISLEQLTRPLGTLAPMGLLWTYMGYSPAYTVFAGLAEFVGGVLLFFRRTTTLGALIVLGVMANVAFMNFAYAVPVKFLSVNLCVFALVLIAPDAQRLLNVLVWNRAALPADETVSAMPVWLRRVGLVVKPLIMAAAIVAPITIATLGRRAFQSRSPLYGLYEVAPPSPLQPPARLSLVDDPWRQLIFDRPTSVSVILESGVAIRFAGSIDTVAHRLSYWRAASKERRAEYTYTLDSSGALRLQSLTDSSVAIKVQRVPLAERFPLARSFHWR